MAHSCPRRPDHRGVITPPLCLQVCVCEREREREREEERKKKGAKKVKTLTSCWSRRNFCSFLRMQAGVGMSVDNATPLSDGFCVVREIHRGGAVHIAGYEQKNGEILRVQVGDWLLRVNGISCKHMPRAEVKRSIVGPPDTKVELVFASKRDNQNITVQLFRMLKEKKYGSGIYTRNQPRSIYWPRRGARARQRARTLAEARNLELLFLWFHVNACSPAALNIKAHSKTNI